MGGDQACPEGFGRLVSKSVGNAGYRVYVHSGDLCAWYRVDGANHAHDGTACPLRTPGFSDNQWHHVTLVAVPSNDGAAPAIVGMTVSGITQTSLTVTWTTTEPTTARPAPSAPPPP